MKKRLIISVDMDEWFLSRWATGSEKRSRWLNLETFFRDYYHADKPQGEIYKPTRILLDFFDKYNIKATFFVLGLVASWYPDLIKEINNRGHEIACHGWEHVDMSRYSKEEFRLNLERAKNLLQKIIGQEVIGFRAPNFVIEPWLFEVLENLNFKYDSSVCPSREIWGKYKGSKSAPINPYLISKKDFTKKGDGPIVELPIPVFPIIKVIAGSGIATRVIGRWWSRIGLSHALNTGTAMYYLHPYEIINFKTRINLNLKERIFIRRTGNYLLTFLECLLRRTDLEIINCRETVKSLV